MTVGWVYLAEGTAVPTLPYNSERTGYSHGFSLFLTVLTLVVTGPNIK